MYNVSWFHSVSVLFSAPRVKQPCICSKKIHQLTLWLVFLRLSSFRTRFSGDNLKFLGKFVENIRRKQKKRSTIWPWELYSQYQLWAESCWWWEHWNRWRSSAVSMQRQRDSALIIHVHRNNWRVSILPVNTWRCFYLSLDRFLWSPPALLSISHLSSWLC